MSKTAAEQTPRMVSTLRSTWRQDEWVKPFFARYAHILALTLFLGLLAFIFAGALMFTSGYMISLAATLPLTVLALQIDSKRRLFNMLIVSRKMIEIFENQEPNSYNGTPNYRCWAGYVDYLNRCIDYRMKNDK